MNDSPVDCQSRDCLTSAVREETESSAPTYWRAWADSHLRFSDGSKGNQIGKFVAERLNIPFYYKERTSYYRNISRQKWGDPHNYTLCLDSSVGIDFCVGQICALYRVYEKNNSGK